MPDSLSQFARDLMEDIRRMSPRNPADAEAWFGAQAWRLHRLQAAANPVCRAADGAGSLSEGDGGDWRTIPPVPAAAFKEWDVTALLEPERLRVFCSSGTTGQVPSRHHHSRESLAVYEASVISWFGPHLVPDGDRAPLRWMSLTPAAAVAAQSSLAHMMETVSRRWEASPSAPDHPFYFGTVDSDGAWQVSVPEVIQALEAAVAAGMPVLLMGTAFNCVHLLDSMALRGLRLRLPAGSRVMETGGYKGRSRTLTRTELHGAIGERLGLPAACVVSEYGMSELSSQAYDGVAGAVASPRIFRMPPWARALVVSVETGQEVTEGGTGLLRLLDLANVWSAMAVQTADLAVRRGGGFELLGRAPAAEARGCSLRSPDGD
ncbi:MAG: hypothetical protein J0L84_12150 [Verrucomicrobia bacterium]|nr:hypothetical protein [Verrucomicrobiota bacterium]